MEIDFQTLLAVFTTLGFGGVFGAYVQSILNKRKEIELRNQNIKEERYKTILVWSRIMLNPESLEHIKFEDSFVMKTKMDIKDYSKQKLYEYYYNSLLYAPDFVLLQLKKFLNEPNKKNFFGMAGAMRKDLWGKSKLDTDELMI